ncbi:MAG TPA: CDP-diacylglycerol--glycerol-3-phosphate 3-phosphatidyltransferase [Atopostipes sp.]|nr:CDP-diacylglycerol--glycerol-3-phosphate 3-phosphatidyltransferase [Atopostipes sp.]
MNLPNKLTLLRLLLIPLFLVLLAFRFDWGTVEWLGSSIGIPELIATIIFIIASITDWSDGYIARRDNLVTNFGKFADPMADKILVASALIMLVELNLAPGWVVAVIIAREFAVTGLRLLLVETGGTVLAAAWPGKIKTVTQMLAIIFLLLNNLPFAWTGIPVGSILLYISLFFTVYSGIDYFYNARFVFADTLNK